MRTSLGLLEIKGLASAIQIADVVAKTAAVQLLGLESAKGGGWMTIKIAGDVAAVQAALSAGSEMAKRLNCFVAQITLARPDPQLLQHVATQTSNELQRHQKIITLTPDSQLLPTVTPLQNTTEPTSPDDTFQDTQATSPNNATSVDGEQTMESGLITPVTGEATCNLCHDPACPRVKGEPRRHCLHEQGGN